MLQFYYEKFIAPSGQGYLQFYRSFQLKRHFRSGGVFQKKTPRRKQKADEQKLLCAAPYFKRRGKTHHFFGRIRTEKERYIRSLSQRDHHLLRLSRQPVQLYFRHL